MLTNIEGGQHGGRVENACKNLNGVDVLTVLDDLNGTQNT